MFLVGGAARQEKEVVDGELALAEMDGRIEGDERHREIAGIHGDAGLAGAEHGMAAGYAADRRAAASRFALVAGRKIRGVAEIGAARALHQIAADARHVADLRRSRLPQRLRDSGEAALDAVMAGDMAHLCQCAQPGAMFADLDRVQPFEVADIDQRRGLGDAAFGEVDQRRAAGKQHGAGERGRFTRGVGRGGAKIGKIPHDWTSRAAWRTAATMCG